MSKQNPYAILSVLLILGFIYSTFFPSSFHISRLLRQPPMSFAGRNGTHFIDLDDDTPLYINGWNSYWLMSSGSETFVSEMLRRGRDMGMTLCRTWAFSDGGVEPLQISPGRFDDRLFQTLDFVIYEARRNGIRLILSLVNNLDEFGGKEQYVKWAEAAGVNSTGSPDLFFSDETVKGYYKDYVKTILTRKNSYSGIKYRDEPAIFAWELINEPRCVSNSSAPLLQAWIVEMADYIKSLDHKHLVTIGLEGFYGPNRTERLGVNPGVWASSFGLDFIQNSATRNIDFASVHAYPDTWVPKTSLEEKAKYLSSWIDSHLNDSEYILRKPVLFSEVGFDLHVKEGGVYNRNILLKTVYDKIYESGKKRRAGAGALIWQLMIEEIQGYHDEFSLVAREHPSIYKLIVEQSCRLHDLFFRKGEANRRFNKLCSEIVT